MDAGRNSQMSLSSTVRHLVALRCSFLPLSVRAALLGGRRVSHKARAAAMEAALGDVLDHVDASSPAGQAALRGLNAANQVVYPQRHPQS